jgi:hypothetical protein
VASFVTPANVLAGALGCLVVSAQNSHHATALWEFHYRGIDNPLSLHAELLPQRVELAGRDGPLGQTPAQRLQDGIGPRDLLR